MPEINLTLLTYVVVIIFAIGGFYRGWWKEAITTIALAFLIFLLETPGFAERLIEIYNNVVAWIWDIVPDSFKNFLSSTFGIEASGAALQADANSASTWLLILILLVLGAVILNRFFLPGAARTGAVYTATPMGSILGALLGGLNGFIIINLIIEYLWGGALNGNQPPTEIATSGGQTVAVAPGIDFPSYSVLEGFLPWIIIGLGFLLFVAVLRTRLGIHSRNGYRRIDYRVPYGYEMVRYRRE
jgi:hypothetical protein